MINRIVLENELREMGLNEESAPYTYAQDYSQAKNKKPYNKEAKPQTAVREEDEEEEVDEGAAEQAREYVKSHYKAGLSKYGNTTSPELTKRGTLNQRSKNTLAGKIANPDKSGVTSKYRGEAASSGRRDGSYWDDRQTKKSIARHERKNEEEEDVYEGAMSDIDIACQERYGKNAEYCTSKQVGREISRKIAMNQEKKSIKKRENKNEEVEESQELTDRAGAKREKEYEAWRNSTSRSDRYKHLDGRRLARKIQSDSIDRDLRKFDKKYTLAKKDTDEFIKRNDPATKKAIRRHNAKNEEYDDYDDVNEGLFNRDNSKAVSTYVPAGYGKNTKDRFIHDAGKYAMKDAKRGKFNSRPTNMRKWEEEEDESFNYASEEGAVQEDSNSNIRRSYGEKAYKEYEKYKPYSKEAFDAYFKAYDQAEKETPIKKRVSRRTNEELEDFYEGGGSRRTKAYRQAAHVAEFGKRAIEYETGEKVSVKGNPQVYHNYVDSRFRDDEGRHREKNTEVEYKGKNGNTYTASQKTGQFRDASGSVVTGDKTTTFRKNDKKIGQTDHDRYSFREYGSNKEFPKRNYSAKLVAPKHESYEEDYEEVYEDSGFGIPKKPRTVSDDIRDVRKKDALIRSNYPNAPIAQTRHHLDDVNDSYPKGNSFKVRSNRKTRSMADKYYYSTGSQSHPTVSRTRNSGVLADKYDTGATAKSIIRHRNKNEELEEGSSSETLDNTTDKYWELSKGGKKKVIKKRR